MTKRQRITAKIAANNLKIDKLRDENVQLHYKSILLNDKVQWYTEEIETWGRGRKKATHTVGYINWKEDFKDESTGDVITIKRRDCVRVDGEWKV